MTETIRSATGQRECRLYRFYGWDPRTGYTTKTLIYVGETGRQPFERLMEHIDAQPWADTITSWEVDDEVFAGKPAVLAAEAAAIRGERPLYNVKGNMANPVRVKPWEAVEQRHRRDDEAGRPRWVAPVGDVSRGAVRPQRRAASVRRRGKVQRWRITAAAWVGAWVLLAAMLWDTTAAAGWTSAGRAWTAVIGPAVALGWGTWKGPRMWRRWVRALRRWLR